MYRLLVIVLLAAFIPQVHAQSPSTLPVTHVTLYTSGVGYFERTGTVTDDSSTTLFFPVEQVNDVLKSLVLLDYDGGTIEPVTYGAQDPVAKQLKAFSVDLSDDPSQATLLDRLRGADVTVTVSGSTSAGTGTIVGVETKTTVTTGQGTTQESTINLLTADSLVAIPLATVSSIQIVDSALRDELKEALATVALGRDTSKRPVTIDFSGKGQRKVLIGYLTQTPLWQTTYRLILGKSPYLQGWALVQNTSQEDWSNVSLSLVAGRPISFIQDLYTPVYVDRPVVQPTVVGSPVPQLYSSNLDIDNYAPTTPASTVGTFALPTANHTSDGAPPFGFQTVRDVQINGLVNQPEAVSGTDSLSSESLAKSAGASGAQLGTSLFSYSIKVPVTVPRQKSAMIPFVGSDVEAERVSIYNNDTDADHPLTGAKLTNTSGVHLMGGPITVFDSSSDSSNGYVGDALIDDMEPGQSRLLSFAVDLAVDADMEDDGTTEQTTRVTISKGVLTSRVVDDTGAVYTFKNNSSQDRTIIVEHPFNDDSIKLIEPTVYDEKTATVYRFRLDVPSHASKKLKVVLESVQSEVTAINSLTDDGIAQIAIGGGIDQAAKDALHQVVVLRGLVADTQNKIVANENQMNNISAGQDRIRKNMVILDKSTALYKRYADELDAQETVINNLTSQHNDLENELSTRQNNLSNYIQTLSVD